MSKKILFMAKIALKLCILLFLTGIFVIGYMDTNEIDMHLHYFYGTVMSVCLFSFLCTFFYKYQKIAYIVFFLSFTVFFLMGKIPLIKEVYDSLSCLEAEKGVWDYDRHECRHDCWRWDKEHGCYKDEKAFFYLVGTRGFRG